MVVVVVLLLNVLGDIATRQLKKNVMKSSPAAVRESKLSIVGFGVSAGTLPYIQDSARDIDEPRQPLLNNTA